MSSNFIGQQSHTLIDILQQRAQQQANELAFTFLSDNHKSKVTLTYGELDRRARTIAAWLEAQQARGERVLLLYPPGMEFVVAFFACLYSGAIAVPVYPPDPSRLERTLPRLLLIANDAQPRFVLTTALVLGFAEYMVAEEPQFQQMQWLATDKLPISDEITWQPHLAIKPEAVAFLQYTSGSTSNPKGVMVSHGNLFHNSQAIYHCFGHSATSRGVIWLPLYHDMGLIGGVLQPLFAGFPVVLFSPISFLEKPFRWLQAISQTGATTSGGPNFAYDLCVRKITPAEKATLDLSQWRVAFNGAEPLRPETIENFTAAFESCGFRKEAFLPCYGLAEATLIVSGDPSEQRPLTYTVNKQALKSHQISTVQGDQTLISCGPIVPGQKVIIVDPQTETESLHDQVGEIWIAGPSVAQGYWQQPAETARNFQAYLSDTKIGPFLRTGDLGFMREGELYVTGRLKDLIIIRGRNYYPQDIELAVEQSHSQLRPGCTAAFSVEVDGQEQVVVVAEVDTRKISASELDTTAIITAIRTAVVRLHELYLYGVVLLKAGAIYKTSSGKVQRQACRSAFLAQTLEVVTTDIAETTITPSTNIFSKEDLLLAPAPTQRQLLTNYLQHQLAQILQTSVTSIDSEKHLNSLGLDSLMVVELKNQLSTDLGSDLPLISFFQPVTISELAGQILAQLLSPPTENSSLNSTIISKNLTTAPLSYEQERLWFLEKLSGKQSVYNISEAVILRGELVVDLLAQSLSEVIGRHASLRTIIGLDKEGAPIQIVTPPEKGSLPLVDLADLDETTQLQRLTELTQQLFQQDFDLTTGPLRNFCLVKRAAQEHWLILVIHHIVCDGWSLNLIVQEMATIYQQLVQGLPVNLPEPEIQFTDFAYWQKHYLTEEYLKPQGEFWQQQLVGAPPLLDIPTDMPRPTTISFRGAHHFFTLPASLNSDLREFSRQQGVTLFMLLVTAFKAMLCRYAQQDDIVIGSPVSGRLRPETRDLVGFLAYPIALRTDLSGDPTFVELLQRVRQVVLAAYEHQEMPFAKVVEAVRPKRNLNYSPIFQIMFSLLSRPFGGVQIPNLSLSSLELETGLSEFDMFLTLFDEKTQLSGVWGYNVDLFEHDTIEHLYEFYVSILTQLVTQPTITISALTFPPELLNRTQTRLKVVIGATFPAEPLRELVGESLTQQGLPNLIKLTSNNQIFQQLLDPTSPYSRNRQGINVVLIRLQDWQRRSQSEESPEQRLFKLRTIESNLHNILMAFKSALSSSLSRYLVCLLPYPEIVAQDPAVAAFYTRMEALIEAELRPFTSVYLVKPHELEGVKDSPEYDYLYEYLTNNEASEGKKQSLNLTFYQPLSQALAIKLLEFYLITQASEEDFAQSAEELL